MVPVLLAVVGATVVTRLAGAPSIYAARLGMAAGRDREPEHDVLPATLVS